MPKYLVKVLVVGVVLLGSASTARADLLEYVKKPDPKFSWKLKSKQELPQGTVYDLSLVSQEWQGITWEHDIQVFLPKGVKPNGSMFIWNQGGKASLQSTVFGMELAVKMQAPVAIVFGIPNQPLLDGKKEDALIAETFIRYLKSKDESWPLLFPMVKSLVRAMDALQEFAKQEWNVEIRDFVVSGASKRGWTTWLTGAADARVKAIAPLVIDTLNFQLQMPHQLKSFGKYSEMINDYTERGLVPMPDTPEAKKLWKMVDPWHYKDRLKMPIMIINGANDPYWSTDALNLYWNDLTAPKWVLYVPNAGHGLQQEHADGKKDRDRSLNTLSLFAHCQIHQKPMPKLTWEHANGDGKQNLTVTATQPPKAARLWVASAPTLDFRKAKWQEHTVTLNKGNVAGAVALPQDGYQAMFGELEFELKGTRFFLSTQMSVVGKNGTAKAAAAAKVKELLDQLKKEEKKAVLVVALGDLREEAAPAIPALLELFADKDEYLRLQTAIALGKIGKPAVAPLAKAVDATDPDVRFYAVWALAFIGPNAKSAAPVVLQAMEDKSPAVRRKAAYALGRIDPDPAAAIKALAVALADENEDVAKTAAATLPKFGDGATPVLVKALKGEDTKVRLLAMKALGEVGPGAKTAIPELKAFLFVADKATAAATVNALVGIGEEALPTLVQAVQGDSTEVRTLAVQGLKKVGVAAVPHLVDLLGAKHVDVRRQAAAQLGFMQVQDKSIAIALGYALKDEDKQVRLNALNSLRKMGSAGKHAEKYIRELLNDSDLKLRQNALFTLKALGLDTSPGVKKP